MAVGNLRRQADRLAAEAARLHTERNEHARRCLAIARRRLASPGGLAACFGAGLLVGQRGSRRERPRSDSDRTGGVRALLRSPMAAAALRAASAFAGAHIAREAP